MQKQVNQKSSGFTLIEVMIVVAVIAIIAAVAIPSYNSSILKSKRAIGKGELMEVLSEQEQYFVNNKGYATTLASLGYSVDANDAYYIDSDGIASSASTGSSTYKIYLTAGATTSGFTVEADPINSQAADTDCDTLKLSSTGLKSVSGSGANCW